MSLDFFLSRFFDKLGGALESDRPNSNLNFNNKSYDYLDDIESASQVFFMISFCQQFSKNKGKYSSCYFYSSYNKVLILNYILIFK